jgi:phage/plasmid-associated DNA primase
LSSFLNKALAAFKVLLENDGFSYDKTVKDVKRMYQINSNSVAAFADECVESDHGNISKSVS